MKSAQITTFHGSPGTPFDFEPLKRAIPQLSWNGFLRYKEDEPILKSDETKLNFAMGYSYGAGEAILAAAKNPNYDALILISPFAFCGKQSLIKKLVVVAPLLGNKILEGKKEEIIDEFLVKSSSPSKVPDIYKTYGEHLKNALLLKAAVWEKKQRDEEILTAIRTLKDKNIPILIIWGKGDETGTYKEQVKPLLDIDNKIEVEELADAGHALIYSHYIDAATICGTFIRKLIKKESYNELVVNGQNEAIKKHNYLTPETPFGYHKGEHELNNVASFLYHHLQKNKKLDILTWVHPRRLEYWDKTLEAPLPHDSINVEDLDILVGRIGAGLKKMGLQKNDKVIIFIPMSLYLYAAMFAVQKIGAVAVFLDSWARRDQMGVAVDVVSPKMIISVEKAFEYLSHVDEIQAIPLKVVAGPHEEEYSQTLEKLMNTNGYAEAEPVESEHTALITFTTGSSGTPKGADRTHRFLAAQHYALNRHLPYEEGDADLPAFPIFSLNNLAAGVKTVIPAFDVGTPSEDDATIILRQFKETECTCTTLSPSLLRTLYNRCLKDGITLPDLKRVVTGGAPVSNDDVVAMKKVAPNAEVLVLYGSTEVEPMAHIEAEEMLGQKSKVQDPRYVDDGVNVGKFDSGLKVKYIKIIKESIEITSDEDWKEIEIIEGKVGEIIVSGEHVCEKYFNNEEATKKTKIRDHKG
ncbi:MAG: AMP-binding protein, partial [Halobacteriovoraceae bacterium]|nr:AMP-binding protein [Halobacteriovoraceae bacterium]